ncbi:acetate--CoA ligase alpha subunit [[Eubacterium] cellulosolvens]
MATLSLDRIFKPKSIALIGASDEEGSIGYILMKNLTELGYKGKIYAVNINNDEIFGLKAYKTVEQIPEVADLAVIATPAKTVPNIIEQCGKAGIQGVIIISAGFKEIGAEGKELENKILEIQKNYNLRIIGPNCLGIIQTSISLNATFTTKMPKPGNIAFISQSGALGASIIDWAITEGIGFSNFVSVGSMIDVDFGDLIDYFGTDQKTSSILMYVEGITDVRKFMSAARHFARTKPIIIVKAGKFGESAKAAASHTGSLTGEDMVYDAAFKRAGIVRAEEIEDLFNIAEVLGMQSIPKGPNLAIITNSGGPGIMATDALIARGGKLAKLNKQTIEKLDKILPYYWSKANPIDILGDARENTYNDVVQICLNDENIDGLLIIHTATGRENPVNIANRIVEQCRLKHPRSQKTILTSFMGYEQVKEANRILNENGIPTYSMPEKAVATYMYMYQYKRNLELLYETPEELPISSVPPKRPLILIMRNAAKENRKILTEVEAKQLLDYYNIPVVKSLVAKSIDEAKIYAEKIGYPIVLKILSPQIIHKTDAGGVILDITSETQLKEAYNKLINNAKKFNPNVEIQGVTIQPMIKSKGYEVILGAKSDSLFGPVILFGTGGVGVEVFEDVALGLPPLNQTLAKRIMEETKCYKLLKGFRNAPPANISLLERLMVQFSQMLVDFPEISEVDINPLFIDEKNALALDARIVIDIKRALEKFEPHEHLVISPYPKKYESLWNLRDGRTVLLRPIKPEDETLWLEMFQNFSEESRRYRFFEIIKDAPHELRIRYCNIDYDREMAIVAELDDNNGRRRILGVVRMIIEPDGKTGEIAFIVADPWQKLGLGSKMVDYMIEICKEKSLETIYAIMLPDNKLAVELVKKMGFKIERIEDETVKATLNLKEEVDKIRNTY